MKLKLDLHVHSCLSDDGISTPEELLRAARERGLDGIALTDHNLLSEGRDEYPFIIPGCEFSTSEGHILGLFIDELPSCVYRGTGPLPSADEVIRAIHENGGVAVWAHPYERHMTVNEDTVRLCDLVETSNSRACFKNKKANDMAKDLAARLSLPCTGGSDAHRASELGNSFTQLACQAESLNSIKVALLTGNTAAVHVKDTRRINKGLSQLEKCRKKHATLPRMVKAYIYILYCLLSDLFKR